LKWNAQNNFNATLKFIYCVVVTGGDTGEFAFYFQMGTHMTSAELISMYERIAKLTSEMVIAARTRNWDALSQLEDECADQNRLLEESFAPALTGESRLRKVALLKQILANDRAIREITEPWMAQMENVMHAARTSQSSQSQYAVTQ
jgi:flagellar protein FliT